jgi:hypothetical protein
MFAILLAARDFLLAIALNWVGVTLEPPSEVLREARPPAPAASSASPSASSACVADGGACITAQRPGFNALDCTGQ